MRKWVVIALVPTVLLTVVGFSLQTLWTSTVIPGLTEENFRRLHGDMTQKEVEAIFGGPAEMVSAGITHDGERAAFHHWNMNGCKIVIYFRHLAEDEPIASYGWFGSGTGVYLRPRPKSFFEQARDFLGL